MGPGRRKKRGKYANTGSESVEHRKKERDEVGCREKEESRERSRRQERWKESGGEEKWRWIKEK